MPPRRLDRAAGVLLGAAVSESVSTAASDPARETPRDSAREAPRDSAREAPRDPIQAPAREAVRLARAAAAGMDLRGMSLEAGPSLAWTGTVALAHLTDRRAAAETARQLTDPDDPLSGDAAVLWAEAIRAAVTDGSLAGPAAGLDLIAEERRTHWASWITQAQEQPSVLSSMHNGPFVPLMQAAWSAVVRTPVAEDSPAAGVFACGHLATALEAAARAGDSVAATAGALLGARWGASAVPFEWLRALRGERAAHLVRVAALVAGGGRDDARGWPSLARRPLYAQRVDPAAALPCDTGVLLGGLGSREADADAVVSLCQVGHADFEHVPAGDHLELWLVDHPGDNNQPHFVIDQAARAIAAFRAEGKRVFLHCHAGLSRTPAVAARYACLASGMDPATAFAQVAAATGRPSNRINHELRAAVYELAGVAPPLAGDSPVWDRSQR